MKALKKIVWIAGLVLVVVLLASCASDSHEDVFLMEVQDEMLVLKNENSTLSYNLDEVKYLSYSQSGSGKDAYVCEDRALMSELFSAMFAAPITMEKLSGDVESVLASYPLLAFEREVAFSFVFENGEVVRWIFGFDGMVALVASNEVYLSPSRTLDYSTVTPHLSWFVITHRDANGNRYDVSADGKTFLYYYPDNPTGDFMVPEGIETVAETSFRDARNVRELTFSSTVKTIEGDFFSGACFERVVIPETVESVKYSFYNCRNLRELICAAPMTVFYGAVEMPALELLVLPSTLTKIGIWAFDGGLPSLKEIRTYGEEPIKDEVLETFCGETVYYLPEGVTELSIDHLIGLNGTIYLPDSCKTFYAAPEVYLADSTFTISVSADTEVIAGDYYDGGIRIWRRGTENEEGKVTLEDIHGNRYDLSADGLTLLYYHAENTGRIFTVPNGVQAVLWGAFADIPCLKELSFSNTVLGIGRIFYDGITLEKITLPSSLAQYENSTFEIHSTTLKHLDIYCEVGGLSLSGCENLETVYLENVPSGLGSNEEDLNGCNSLRKIWVRSEESCRDEAFESYCATKNNYPVLYLPNGMETLCADLITACVNVYIPDSVTAVDYACFGDSCGDRIVSVPAHAEIVNGVDDEAMQSVSEVIRRAE